MADTAVLNLSIGTKKALKDLNNFNKELTSVGKTISVSISAPLIALGTIAVKTFSEMETGLTSVTNLLDNNSGFESLSEDLKEMQVDAIEFGFSIQDTNKALFDNVSALGSGESALKSYSDAQKLALGGDANLSVAVDGTSSIMNAYGKELTNSTDVVNAFFLAQKAGKTTVAELASSIGKVAPIAKTADIGFEELLATTSALTLGGLSTAEAVTGVKGAINSLINPSDSARKSLQELGIASSLSELKTVGLTATLSKIREAYNDNNDIITELIPNQEALTAVAAFDEKLLKTSIETQKKMNAERGKATSLTTAQNEKLDDFDIKLNQAKGSMMTMLDELGEILVDGLELKELLGDLGEGFRDIKDYLKKLSPEQKENISDLAKWAVAIPLVTTAVLGLGTAFSTASKAVKGLNVAIQANPVMLALAAGVMLGAEAVDFFEERVGKLDGTLTGISKKLSDIDASNLADYFKNGEFDGVMQNDLTLKKLSDDKKIHSERMSQIKKENELKAKLLKERTESNDINMEDFIFGDLEKMEEIGLNLLGPDKSKNSNKNQGVAQALEKGSIQALEKEKSSSGNKTQVNILKEQKKQTKEQKKQTDYLNTLSTNSSSEETVTM